MAIFVPLACQRGEDVVITDTLAGSGSLAGQAFTFALLKNYADASPLVTKTVGSGVTIADAAGRVLTVALAAADTTQVPGDYVYTISRSDAGAHALYTYGPLTIYPAQAR